MANSIKPAPQLLPSDDEEEQSTPFDIAAPPPQSQVNAPTINGANAAVLADNVATNGAMMPPQGNAANAAMMPPQVNAANGAVMPPQGNAANAALAPQGNAANAAVMPPQGNAGNAANAALAPQGNAGNAANAALAPQGNASLEPQTNASIDSSEDGDDAVPMYGGGANSAFSEGSLDIGDGELYLTLASMFKSAQGESLADILSSIAKSLQTLVLNKDGAAEEAE